MKYFRHGLTELLSEALLPGAILNSVKVINILKTPGYEQTFLRKPTMPYSIICKHTIARTAITQVQRRGPSRRLGGFLTVSVLGGPFFHHFTVCRSLYTNPRLARSDPLACSGDMKSYTCLQGAHPPNRTGLSFSLGVHRLFRIKKSPHMHSTRMCFL